MYGDYLSPEYEWEHYVGNNHANASYDNDDYNDIVPIRSIPSCGFKCGSPMRMYFISASDNREVWKEQTVGLVHQVTCTIEKNTRGAVVTNWTPECGCNPRGDSIAAYIKQRDRAIARITTKIFSIIEKFVNNLILLAGNARDYLPFEILLYISKHLNDPLFYFLCKT